MMQELWLGLMINEALNQLKLSQVYLWTKFHHESFHTTICFIFDTRLTLHASTKYQTFVYTGDDGVRKNCTK